MESGLWAFSFIIRHEGSRFKVLSSRLKVQGLKFKVQGSRFSFFYLNIYLDSLPFLALAASGKAAYLITGDQDLLVLQSFKKTKIVTVNDIAEIMLGNAV